MNTVEKEMLRMLILFILSYLPYIADNFVVLNDTIIPMQPVKQLLYQLQSFNVFNQYQKYNLHRHHELLSNLIFTIKTFAIIKAKSNARNRLGLCSAKFLHVGSYRIKVELTCSLIFKFSQVSDMIWHCIYVIQIIKKFLIWLQIF